jgi:Xaa-Pro aminopeptidase
MFTTVLFPREDMPVLFRHGPANEQDIVGGEAPERTIAKLVTRPNFPSANFTRDYYAEAAGTELRRLRAKTIGIVNGQTIGFSFLEAIRSALPDVAFVDATDLVDRLKAVKSDEEIALIRRCAAMQDAAMQAVREAVRPGVQMLDLMAVAQEVGARVGSFDGIFLMGSGPIGQPVSKKLWPHWNRVLGDRDQFTILVESNGPNGFYCELGRTFVIGEAPRHMRDEFDFVLEAQRFTLEMVRPGASPSDILARYNEFMRHNGRPEERRIYAHGQGYDLVERPLFLAEETMELAAGMNLAIHPTYSTQRDYAWLCDNYLVTAEGVSPSLHSTPRRIFEV